MKIKIPRCASKTGGYNKGTEKSKLQLKQIPVLVKHRKCVVDCGVIYAW